MLNIILKALRPLGCLPVTPIVEELIVLGMQERISEILNHDNAFIFLLGDLTTIEMLITFISWAHLKIHQKSIGV